MRLCSEECKPCCDFCIYVVHETWDDKYGKYVGGPISCILHEDEKHQQLAENCGYCEDFYCFRVDK